MTSLQVRPTQLNQPIALPPTGTAEVLPAVDISLLGRRITCMTTGSILQSIDQACQGDRSIVVANYNVNSFNFSMELPWFYDFMQSADITHCDGTGILKAIEYMGLKLPADYRVSYTTLMPEVLNYCETKHRSMFLLGSKPEFADKALENLRQQYPNIKAYGHHGYFSMEDAQENNAIIDQINQVEPDILLLGMGVPRQEAWAWKHRHQVNAKAILLGGAAIDRLAGGVVDCPKPLSNLGLEWVYRLIQEPNRLANRYLVGNPAFALHVVLGKSNHLSLQIKDHESNNWITEESLNFNDLKFSDFNFSHLQTSVTRSAKSKRPVRTSF
jgi:N-acetylglucosaminyldiphosphoundecaprenol N-acetyl-beta-D-mannosaminyltransferase